VTQTKWPPANPERFINANGDDGPGTYVLALDDEKKPCRVRASNAGHALFAGVALPESAAPVAQTLMGSSSFCGWGIRTIASGEARSVALRTRPNPASLIAADSPRRMKRGRAFPRPDSDRCIAPQRVLERRYALQRSHPKEPAGGTGLSTERSQDPAMTTVAYKVMPDGEKWLVTRDGEPGMSHELCLAGSRLRSCNC
jgi:hypothetical protein